MILKIISHIGRPENLGPLLFDNNEDLIVKNVRNVLFTGAVDTM